MAFDESETEVLHPALSTPNGYSVPDEYASGISEGKDQAQGFYSAAFYIDTLQEALANGSGIGLAMSSISPGGSYKFGDGTITSPSISWTNDPTDGFYRVGSHDEAYVVNSVKVTEWLASEFRVNYLTLGSVVYAGASGKLTQDNTNFFWDASALALKLGDGAYLQMGTKHPVFPNTVHEIQSLSYSFNGPLRVAFQNTNAGASAHSTISTLSDEGNDSSFGIMGSGFVGTPSAGEAFWILNTGAGGGPGGRGMYLLNALNSYIRFGSNSTERARLLSTGEWGFNTTTARRQVDVLSTSGPQLRLTYTDNSVYTDLQTDSGGVLTITTTGTSVKLPYLTSGSVLFAGTGGAISQNNASFFWDNTNKFLLSLGTSGKQIRLAQDSTHYLDINCVGSEVIGGNTFTNNITLTPSGTQDAFYSLWRIIGSDFCFSYTGSLFNGQGVPNVTISGPPNTGTYTAASGPGLNLNNELSALNSKLWSMYLNDQVLTFNIINDANNSAATWLKVTRSALTLTDAQFGTHVRSSSDGGLDLGGTSNRWRVGYFSSRVQVGYSINSVAIGFAMNQTQALIDSSQFTLSKTNSQGTAWSGATTLPSFMFNGAAADRPEISWYRGSRAAPEFSIRQHTTADTGGEIWAGPGTASPTLIMQISQSAVGIMGQANGQKIVHQSLTELTTIAAAATTDTVIQIPLNAVVFAVSVRVVTVIPTAATFTVTGTTSGTQFDVAGGVAVAANTTDVGTRNCPFKNGAAQTIRITPNINPAAATGQVRVTIHYYSITPATS